MAPRRNQRGFTLLELLVVLAIIGLVVALVPGFMLRSQPQLDLQVAARAIADGMRQTRSEAVVRNLSDAERRTVLQGTATRVYRLF